MKSLWKRDDSKLILTFTLLLKHVLVYQLHLFIHILKYRQSFTASFSKNMQHKIKYAEIEIN